MKKRFLPFSMMPASWGLNGKSRLRAEAEYYMEGYELERAIAAIDADTDVQAEIAQLGVDLKYEKITEPEHNKKVASIQDEPWVDVVELGFDQDTPNMGFFELDWNDEFIVFLHSKGITGRSDEDAVNTWFNSVCATVLAQEKADQDYGLEENTKNGQSDVEYVRRNNKGKTSSTDE